MFRGLLEATRGVADPKERGEAIKILSDVGVKVVEEGAPHFKTVIVDNEIIYLGSINPLSILPGSALYLERALTCCTRSIGQVLLVKFCKSMLEGWKLVKWIEI